MDPVVKELLFSKSSGAETKDDQPPDNDAAESSSPRLAIHETEQRYAFGEILGEGSYGKVYLCTLKVTGDVFACKTIEKDQMSHQIVKTEINIMKKLSHPNIVSLQDCYQDDDNFYLVMDLCSGGTLSDQMKIKGRYTEMEAAGVTRQIVEALKICHQSGVIHHDLKPDNVMFVDEKVKANLKIIDFGLSMMFKTGERLDTKHSGTLHYKAPELFLEDEYGPEIDIWSAGVILYELLFGTRPFNIAENCRIYRRTLSLRIAVTKGVEGFNWEQKLPDISAGAIDLLKKMLDTKPSVRITAEEVLAHPWIQSAKYGSTS